MDGQIHHGIHYKISLLTSRSHRPLLFIRPANPNHPESTTKKNSLLVNINYLLLTLTFSEVRANNSFREPPMRILFHDDSGDITAGSEAYF